MKNRSHKYDINKPRSRHGHKYSKHKKFVSMMRDEIFSTNLITFCMCHSRCLGPLLNSEYRIFFSLRQQLQRGREIYFLRKYFKVRLSENYLTVPEKDLYLIKHTKRILLMFLNVRVDLFSKVTSHFNSLTLI